MEELREKEYYRQSIIDMINRIDNVEFLIYLHRFIQNILKAGN